MQVILYDEAAQQTRLSISTIRERVRAGTFPQPLALGERRRGFLQSDIDEWLKGLAATRDDAGPKPLSPGRQKFWDDVKAQKRPHPRTAGRLRREAAAAAATESPEPAEH